jgi:dinuclear metal center YbgI/SA1388 family protein
MTELKQLLEVFDRLWPLSGADEWDKPGLVSGSLTQNISKVLLTVDITSGLIDDAIGGGFDLVLAHHPFLLRGVNSVSEQSGKGSVLAKAIRHNLAIYAAHTNADITESGVSSSLAKAFGLAKSEPLVKTGENIGHGRIGDLPDSGTLLEFARRIAKVLPGTAAGLKVAGNSNQNIKRVALCGGAGDAFIDAAFDSGADVYLTSDLRHHPVQDVLEKAIAQGREFSIIDISHWAAESVWLEVAAKELENALPNVKFEVSDLRTDPWDFAVTQ